MDQEIEIIAGAAKFVARLYAETAPRTCAAVRSMLPIEGRLVHARWSGEACWVPLGEVDVDVAPEDTTRYPGIGELLLYPGGMSEAEILLPYGPTSFASRAGPLAGNRFARITAEHSRLAELGRLVLWDGAQYVVLRER